MESIETKVRATIAKYRMFNFNDKIAVAVSGGKDSLSLLHILARMERRRPKSSLVAVTVDEGIKGYRDEALKLATENCEELKIPQHVVSFKELYGITFDEVVSQKVGRLPSIKFVIGFPVVLRFAHIDPEVYIISG